MPLPCQYGREAVLHELRTMATLLYSYRVYFVQQTLALFAHGWLTQYLSL
jgi:hypothetical protein